MATTHYPEDPDTMETVLIEEIVRLQSQLERDLLGPSSAATLRAATTEGLGRRAAMRTSRCSTAGWPCAAVHVPAEKPNRRWAHSHHTETEEGG